MKKAKTISLIVEILLCGFGLAVTLADLTVHCESLYYDLATVLLFAIAVFYTFYEYMVPHGDMLRLALLAFALICGVMELTFDRPDFIWVRVGYLICVIFATYLSGRLNKRTECTVLFVLTEGILAAVAVADICLIKGGMALQYLMPCMKPILWGCFATAYLSRYNEHKEAGQHEADDGE